MTRKRGKSRTSDATKRFRRFRYKYDINPLTKRSKKLLPIMYPQIEDQLIKWDTLEKILFPRYDELGIPADQQPYYTAWAKRKGEICLRFIGETRDNEFFILDDEFIRRGLNETWLNDLSNYVREWNDEVIGKPHSKACWFNRCEYLEGWTVDAQLTKSVDGVDFKEWLGSMKLVRDTNVVGDALFYPNTQDICGDFFGFWFKPLFTTPPPYTTLNIEKLKEATGEYQRFRCFYSSPLAKYVYVLSTYIGGAGLTSGEIECPQNQWLWIELYHYPSENTFYLRVNGVVKAINDHVGSGWSFSKLRGYVESGKALGTVKLDYWRLASELEYPPT